MDDWQRIEQLFLAACERPAHERETFIRDQCAGDDVLLREVRSLLDSDSQAVGYLQTSALDLIGEAGAASGDDQHGRTVGPYRLIKRLGAGGMGAVYLAQREDEQFQQTVAIKLIKRGMDTDEIIRRFRRERQVLARLSHPNIARLFDGGTTDDGLPWFAMEHVDGVPIDQWCDEHRLPIEARLELFCTVCDAIHYAHQNLIVHRDLKPANVLVTNEGIAKVLDFGIARLLSGEGDGEAITIDAGSRCTPAYASPEQIRGEAITTASDVYSLGVILFELLTGRSPYPTRARHAAELSEAVRTQQPLRLTSAIAASAEGASAEEAARNRNIDVKGLRRMLRGDLETILLTALQKEPHRRYGTAEALAQDIRRWRAGFPITARPDTLGYRTRTFVRRNRVAVAATTLVICGLVGGLVLVSTLYRDAEAARATAEQRSKELEQLAGFQARQFSGIDVWRMGTGLRDGIINRAQGALARLRVDQDVAEAELESIRDLLARIDFTSVALDSLYDNVFAEGLAAIDRDFRDRPLFQAVLLQEIASTMQSLGLVQQASEPQFAALEIRRRLLGDEHPQTLASIDSTGGLLVAMGRFSEAETSFTEALERRRRVLGGEHPDTLASLNNLGVAVRRQGRLDEAESHFRQVIDARLRVLGRDHVDTLTTMQNLSVVLGVQGRLAEAEELLRFALEGQRRVLGEHHPMAIQALSNLGTVIEFQDRYDEAAPLRMEAMERARALLGARHPETLTAIANLGSNLRKRGLISEAVVYHREALDGFRQSLGPNHEYTLIALGNLGFLLIGQDRHAEAEPILRESLAGFQQTLGDDHTRTLKAMSNLATLLRDLDRMEESLALHVEVCERAERVLPAGHWELGNYLHDHGRTLLALKRYAEAEPILQRAYSVFDAAFGGDDERSRKVAATMAALYEALHESEPGGSHDAAAAKWRSDAGDE